jgi:hypothetical protein
MQPDNMNQAPVGQEPIGTHGETDREGAMAKADLHKLASYSIKLFKKIQDEDQLEGWVQAKITKAADYIASVYHYLEYEMEFSDYGAKLDNSEMYNEDQKLAIKNKLMEAKAKVAELKKLQATKVKEAFDDKAKVGDTKKTPTGELTKTDKGVIHKNTSYKDEGDEIASNAKSGKGIKSHAKAQSAAEKKDRAPALKQSPKSAKTWGMKDGAKFDNRDKVAEATKSDKADKDYDGDGEVESGKDEYLGSKIRAAKKAGKLKEGTCSACHKDPCVCKKEKKCNECGMFESKCECSTNESAKPSAGMTKKEKSAVVKDAKAGKDIGKPGKSFDKVAKAAGGGKKGEKIAAAAMWKNKAKSIKESLDAMSGMPVEEAAMDQMDSSLIALMQRAKEADPAGLEQAMQQGPEALTTFLQTILSKIEQKVDTGDTPDTATPPQGTAATPANPEPQTTNQVANQVSESSDTTRMREQLTRLNRNENIIVKESSEVDQLRALTQRLVG